ncbi:uncharacterized protein LOC143509286 [Brachyhypopomus gauderio]|uniref:uncharacterized protein LOC143509286 n=1 Tax=Brachyhypopomus gauderio TaxID=698409 RepID=UPI004041915D
MYLCGLDKAKLYMTAYLLWLAGCVSKKVYFECGARLDVSNTQGLILSPGFPHNYSSHTHCVWQFVVPAGHLLTMEMLDFDVFESHGDAAGSPTASAAVSVESLGDGVEDLSPFMDELISTGGRGRAVKEPGPARGAELKRGAELTQLVFQEESGRVHVAAGPPSPVTPTTAVEWDEDTSTETQLSGVDVCPHDVLYISDLLTFSSRFCGSNHPASGQLEFGSDAEMVEVVLELITTTHWGRGFALLFYYRNWTQALAAGQSSLAPSDGTVATLVAAVCGAALFSMAMGCTLWVIFRPKLCAKGSNTTPSIESEVNIAPDPRQTLRA